MCLPRATLVGEELGEPSSVSLKQKQLDRDTGAEGGEPSIEFRPCERIHQRASKGKLLPLLIRN